MLIIKIADKETVCNYKEELGHFFKKKNKISFFSFLQYKKMFLGFVAFSAFCLLSPVISHHGMV